MSLKQVIMENFIMKELKDLDKSLELIDPFLHRYVDDTTLMSMMIKELKVSI